MKRFNITVNGKAYDVAVEEVTGGAAPAAPVQAAAPAPVAASAPAPAAAPVPAPVSAGGVTVNAPMTGTILDIKIKVGDAVKAGQTIMILEAMKMENDIVAPQDGTIASINVNKGENVETNAVLVTMQ